MREREKKTIVGEIKVKAGSLKGKRSLQVYKIDKVFAKHKKLKRKYYQY